MKNVDLAQHCRSTEAKPQLNYLALAAGSSSHCPLGLGAGEGAGRQSRQSPVQPPAFQRAGLAPQGTQHTALQGDFFQIFPSKGGLDGLGRHFSKQVARSVVLSNSTVFMAWLSSRTAVEMIY